MYVIWIVYYIISFLKCYEDFRPLKKLNLVLLIHYFAVIIFQLFSLRAFNFVSIFFNNVAFSSQNRIFEKYCTTKQQLRQQQYSQNKATINKIQLLTLQIFCVKFYIGKFQINPLFVYLQKACGAKRRALKRFSPLALCKCNIYICCV